MADFVYQQVPHGEDILVPTIRERRQSWHDAVSCDGHSYNGMVAAAAVVQLDGELFSGFMGRVDEKIRLPWTKHAADAAKDE